MADHDPLTEEHVDATAESAANGIDDDMLIEEVSIDGMCGVY